MATETEKFNLILETVAALTEMESIGTLLKNFQPKAEITFSKLDDTGYIDCEIVLSFQHTEEKGFPCNWGGTGKTLEEAMDSCLSCLLNEIDLRKKRLNDYLDQIKFIKE